MAASLLSSLQSAPDCLDVPVNPPVFLHNRKSQRYPCDDFYNLQYQYKVLPLFPTLTLRTLSLYTAQCKAISWRPAEQIMSGVSLSVLVILGEEELHQLHVLVDGSVE